MKDKGLIGFRDNGAPTGNGIPSYARNAAYAPHDVPTVVGARYFPPDPDHDPVTDKPLPMVTGNTYEGGREAYRENVYKTAKANRAKLGFSTSDIRGFEKMVA